MGEFSITHILLVLGLFVLFFGPSRLPGLGQSLGKGIREFKKGLSELGNELSSDHKNAPQAPSPEQFVRKNEPAGNLAIQPIEQKEKV